MIADPHHGHIAPRSRPDSTALSPILGSARRIQALIAIGHAPNFLRRRLGVSRAVMRQLTGRPLRTSTSGGPEMISRALHHRVCVLFDELQMQPGPSAHARELAKHHGWPLPLMWDEELLDDPDAEPIDCRRTPSRAIRDHSDELRDQVVAEARYGATAREIALRLRVTHRTVERKLAEARRANTNASLREVS